jgi:hypothetical protein
MNRKHRRMAGKKKPAPLTSDITPAVIPVDPDGPSYCCIADQDCGHVSLFVIRTQSGGEQYGFPVCRQHVTSMYAALSKGAPPIEPRCDAGECAHDLQVGLNELGWEDIEPMESGILARGGELLLPCPSCSNLGIHTHMLKIRKLGEKFSVEAVAA